MVSEDTFVVTKRGFVKAAELSKDDEILTFNMETGELEYRKPLGIDYEGKIVAIKTENSTIAIARDGKISVIGNSWWN